MCFFLSRTLGGCLQESTHCYTLEVSFFSYQTSTNSQAIPYTEELCKKNIFLINTWKELIKAIRSRDIVLYMVYCFFERRVENFQCLIKCAMNTFHK